MNINVDTNMFVNVHSKLLENPHPLQAYSYMSNKSGSGSGSGSDCDLCFREESWNLLSGRPEDLLTAGEIS